MTSIVVVLLALMAVFIATSSLRRKGRISRSAQMLVVGLMLGVLGAVIVLAWRNFTNP